MSLNMNFDQACGLALKDIPWVSSPGGEVERKKLERQGEESGWATTVVRFPPGSVFPAHGHPLGEEFLVLSGVFSDEHAHFPKYTYVRNPPGTFHKPFSEKGCVLFVKLCQMAADDRREVVVHNVVEAQPNRVLFEDQREVVSIHHLKQGDLHPADGVEILVLDGTISHQDQIWPALAWLRFPSGANQTLICANDAVIWQKKRTIGGRESNL